jgi:hypothetical protein
MFFNSLPSRDRNGAQRARMRAAGQNMELPNSSRGAAETVPVLRVFLRSGFSIQLQSNLG